MRDALTIFDQTVAFCGTDVKYQDVIRNLNVLDYEYSFKMVEDFLAGNYGSAFLTLDEILAKGFNALHFVGSLSTHLRNLVVAKTGGLEPLLELPDSLKKRYQEQAARCSNQFLFEALGITTACETGYKAAVNPRLHIEFSLMRLCYILGKPGDAKPVAPAPAPVKVETPAPEVKPASQATPAPVPQAEVPTRRRAPKTGSSLSMSALMDEKKEEEAPVEAVAGSQALPEDETVRLMWKELAGQYSAKPRLANMLSSGNINLSEENGVKLVEFFVTNEAQKQWVEEKMLRELEGKLRDLTGCQKVNVIVSVTPMEEVEKVPYMPEEKAKDLMEKNPEVKAFVADLGLDTK
jgi:DNA polymerase-3 subunit gamma/tau